MENRELEGSNHAPEDLTSGSEMLPPISETKLNTGRGSEIETSKEAKNSFDKPYSTEKYTAASHQETNAAEPPEVAPPLYVPPTLERSESSSGKEVFEKVVEAAEHDDPIEREYELRHEIKKEDIPSSADNQPQSVGSILAQREPSPEQPSAASTSRMNNNKPKDDKGPISWLTNAPPLYTQAIRQGFIGGVMLLLLTLLLTALY